MITPTTGTAGTPLLLVSAEQLQALVREATRDALDEMRVLLLDEEGWYSRARVAEMFGLDSTETLRDWEKRGWLTEYRLEPNDRAVYAKREVNALVVKVNSGEVKIKGKARAMRGRASTNTGVYHVENVRAHSHSGWGRAAADPRE